MRYRSLRKHLTLLAVLQKPSRFDQYRDFSFSCAFTGGFWDIFFLLFWFFLLLFSVDFCCGFGLHFGSVVCDFDESHRWNLSLLLCSFLYLLQKKETRQSFLNPLSGVLTWHFSCSWAHRFVLFVLSLFFPPISCCTLADGSVKYFWM